MRQRSISSIGVVIVGLVPAIMGGPVFAIVLAALCLIGFAEYIRLARGIGGNPVPAGFVIVPAFGLAALLDGGDQAVLGIAAAALAIPITLEMVQSDLDGAFRDWSLAALGALYLGMPVFAAVALRRVGGDIDADWLHDLASWASFGWDAAPRGLAWLALVIVVTWLSDTGAYLVGRPLGRHRLIPHVSPNKTWEGFIGGLVCAGLTGALAIWLFGLGVNPLIGAVVGMLLSLVGVVGDLAESVLKRQAGVKDSGDLIPGHGGMLDRIDALLFTFPAGWLLAAFVDRYLT
jgi:phosphatidate cytidylyltransferase